MDMDQVPPYISGGPPPLPPQQPPPQKPEGGSGLKKAAGPLAVIGVMLTKFKLLLLPAVKFLPVLLKTGGTMFLSIGVYAMTWGWKFAVGFVLLIFVHECGHLIAAKRLGLKVGAPVFIPFMGAVIALKEAPRNAWIEAQVGIGGPILGTVGALCCWGYFMVTGNQLFGALAYTGFFLNLFNLAPFGFLDGGRIVTALSPWLWLIGAVVILGLMVLHFNFLLLIIFVMSLPRLVSLFRGRTEEEQRYYEVSPEHRVLMGVMYFGLITFLVFAMVITQIAMQPRE